VWLFIDGLWTCVVVDDYFPLHGNKPIFSRNNGSELWVMLLEKAYAKVFGSYQAIESGLTGIALNALTGAPFEYLNKDSKSPINV
jgi:calpain-15